MAGSEFSVVPSDAIEFLNSLPKGSVDLVLGSPPYEARRTYGLGFSLEGEDWVRWMVDVFRAALRCCKGLVAFVVQGCTKKFRYSAVPALLMADLHRAGICLRNPPIYHRVGIPGSGGPDWFRGDYEWVICATNGGRLPWAEPTACGHPPRWAPGGEMSYRTKDGRRINAQLSRKVTHPTEQGHRTKVYREPAKANPGNVISCTVGGGHMGSKLASENEAPYSESLVRRFVLSFSPPGGSVCDPFSGSGTTGAVAVEFGRHFLGSDIRADQVELSKRRIAEKLERMRGKSMAS